MERFHGSPARSSGPSPQPKAVAGRLVALLMFLLSACQSNPRTSLLLDVSLGPGMPSAPEALRVFLSSAEGPVFDDERVPQQGMLQPESEERLGTVVLYVGDAVGPMDINVFATQEGARTGRGRAAVNIVSGKQTQVFVTLMPTAAWPDTEDLLGLGPNGEPCSGDEQCLSGACVDGICCGQKLCRTCESCNVRGSAGICAPIAAGDRDLDPEAACSEGRACDGLGTCRGAAGQICENAGDCASGFCVEGACCNQPCTGACEACGAPGGEGMCLPVPVGAEARFGGCNPAGVCDGKGGCRPRCTTSSACEAGHACVNGACVKLLADGDTCRESALCASGSCIDGRCCKATCGTCMECTGLGGTCRPRPAGAQDPAPSNACTGPLACNGRGACGRATGQRCETDTQCATGHCASGICCDQACEGPCRNCAKGTCMPLVNVADPRGCSGSRMCNGDGECRASNGERCAGDGDCASGHCVDGACCNSACDESCYSCSTGVCTLKVNTTDAQCTGGRRCDGAGSCR